MRVPRPRADWLARFRRRGPGTTTVAGDPDAVRPETDEPDAAGPNAPRSAEDDMAVREPGAEERGDLGRTEREGAERDHPEGEDGERERAEGERDAGGSGVRGLSESARRVLLLGVRLAVRVGRGTAGRVRRFPFGFLVGNRLALLGLVVVALAALYGAARLSTPRHADAAARPATPRRAAVVSSLVACPGAELGSAAKTRFGLVSPSGARGHGSAAVRDASGKRVAALNQAGGGWFGDVTRPSGPLVATGSGAPAAGLTAGQISAGKDDKGELTGTHCTRPATDAWFVGPGPDDGGVRLRLANPDNGPATVSVDVFSDAGRLDPGDVSAIFVPPHGKADVSLADRAAGARLAALHVRTSMGRVSAAVQATGKKHEGADWVPAGSAPSRKPVVPGVPEGPGDRELLVAAPGDRDATVKVAAATPDGTIVPGGEGVLQVPAGSVMPMPLDGMLSGRPCALTLTSDVPVIAGLRARSAFSGGADIAYTAAEPSLDDRGVAAVNRADDGYHASVTLTALGGPVTARVTPAGPTTRGKPKDVRVAAGHTTVVTPDAPPGKPPGYGIVVTRRAGGGRLYAARTLTRKVHGGDLMTIDPLTPAPASVPVYPATGSRRAVTP